MVIHGNCRVARFFDEVLRNGCQVDLVTSCVIALKQLKRRLPDLILCELASMIQPKAAPFRALLEELDLAQPPTVLISTIRFEEYARLRHLKLPAIDCVPQSINPQLLHWKVKNLLSLKDVLERFREQSSRTDVRARRSRVLRDNRLLTSHLGQDVTRA
jgi:DNA-binding response OmpR family regulator